MQWNVIEEKRIILRGNGGVVEIDEEKRMNDVCGRLSH